MPVTKTSDLDTLSKQLQDLCLQSDKIDKEKVKVEKRILKLKSKEPRIGERVRIKNPTYSPYLKDIEGDSNGTITKITPKGRICITTNNREQTNQLRKNIYQI